MRREEDEGREREGGRVGGTARGRKGAGGIMACSLGTGIWGTGGCIHMYVLCIFKAAVCTGLQLVAILSHVASSSPAFLPFTLPSPSSPLPAPPLPSPSVGEAEQEERRGRRKRVK